MIVQSKVIKANPVVFPEFTGERAYMVPFFKNYGLPSKYARWQPTIDQMLVGVDTKDVIFMMLDQREVSEGRPHRRPGLHVDGYWDDILSAHIPGRHSSEPPEEPRHKRRPPTPGHKRGSVRDYREGIILASSVFGAFAYEGEFDVDTVEFSESDPQKRGDCSHIDKSAMRKVPMEPNRVYIGEALHLLHESIPLETTSLRTLVRLNVRNWNPESFRRYP